MIEIKLFDKNKSVQFFTYRFCLLIERGLKSDRLTEEKIPGNLQFLYRN